MTSLYDYTIIGGGMSSLYLACKLLQLDKKLKIKILEKTDHLGGKISSVKINNKLNLEIGTEKFCPELHPLLVDLITQAGLLAKLKRKTNGLQFILADKVYQTVEDNGFPFNTDGFGNVNELIAEAYSIYKKTLLVLGKNYQHHSNKKWHRKVLNTKTSSYYHQQL